MKRAVVLGCVGGVVLAAAGFAAGRWTAGARRPEPEGPVVARFAGGRIHASELRARIAEEGPLQRERYASAEGRAELVRRMAREATLVRMAEERGLQERPEVQRQCDGARVAALMDVEVDAPARAAAEREAELKAYFEQHRGEFAQPARVRVAQLLVAAPADDAARRRTQAAAAAQLLASARTQLARDPDAFSALARARSDDAGSRPYGGQLPLMTEPELAGALGADVAAALFDARTPPGLFGKVVETPRGFVLVQLLERSPAVEPELAALRDALRGRLLQARRQELEARLQQQAEQAAALEVDEAALAAVTP